MTKVKTITLNGKASEYDVKYTKAYVAKIISAQSDLYREILTLPYNAVKEIYVDGFLTAELVGNSLLYVKEKRRDITNHDPYVDRHEPAMPPNAGMGRYKGHTVPDEWEQLNDIPNVSEVDLLSSVSNEWDEDHALDMVMNDMIKDFTDEEIEELNNIVVNTNREKIGIYLQSVTSPPPYWVTDTTAGNIDITYTN